MEKPNLKDLTALANEAKGNTQKTEVDIAEVKNTPTHIEFSKEEKKILEDRYRTVGLKKESIPGIENMSYAEQLLLIDMATNSALEQVREKGREEYASKSRGFIKGFFKRMTREHGTRKAEKKALEDLGKNGIKKETILGIKERISHFKESGLELKGDKNGKYSINFLNAPEDADSKTKELYAKINESGTTFARVPEEWSAPWATKEQRATYKKIKEDYEKAQEAFLATKKDKGEKENAQVVLGQADANLKLMQFMMTSPKAAEDLSKVRTQSTMGKWWKNTLVERGAIATGSFATRLALGTNPATAAIMLGVAGTVGGVRGYKNALESEKKQDTRGKHGALDEKREKAHNLYLEYVKESESGTKITARSNELLREREKLLKDTGDFETSFFSWKGLARGKWMENKTDRAFVPAKGLTKRFEYLMSDGGRLKAIEDKIIANKELTPEQKEQALENSRKQLVEEIKDRIAYTEMKLNKGLVNTGDNKSHAGNELALMIALNNAKALVIANDSPEFLDKEKETSRQEKSEKMQRLSAMTISKEGSIENWRKANRAWKTVRGAAIGIGAALGGRWVADQVKEWWTPGDNGGGGGEIEPTPDTPKPEVEIPTYQEVKVGVSSRGSMQTFADLREALKSAGYTPGDPNNPASVEFIFNENNSSLSKAVGYFDPSQEAESHMGHPGDEYRIKSDGRLVFFDKSAGTEVTLAGESNNTFEVTPDQNAEMFDSGKNQVEGKLGMNGSEGGNLTDGNGSLEDAGVDYDPDAIETSDTDKGAIESQNDRMVDTKNGRARINPNQVLNNPSNNILTAGFTDEKNPGDLPPIYNSGTPKVSTVTDQRFNMGGKGGPNAGGYNDNIVGGPSGVPIEGGNTLTKMLTEDNKFFDESSITQDQIDQWNLLSEKFSQRSGGRIDSFRDVYNQMPRWKQGQIDKVLREYAGFEQNQKILEWFSWEQRSGLGKFFGRLFGNGPGKNLNINIDNDYYGGGRGGGGIYQGGGGSGGGRVSSIK